MKILKLEFILLQIRAMKKLILIFSLLMGVTLSIGKVSAHAESKPLVRCRYNTYDGQPVIAFYAQKDTRILPYADDSAYHLSDRWYRIDWKSFQSYQERNVAYEKCLRQVWDWELKVEDEDGMLFPHGNTITSVNHSTWESSQENVIIGDSYNREIKWIISRLIINIQK